MTKPSEPLLSLNKVSVCFDTRHGELVAVDQLSLTVNRGEILGLVGESGAGKSMTGLAVIGLLDEPGRLSSGEIWLDDRRIDTCPETVRGKTVSMIFQDPLTSLNPLRTIGDQLIETIQRHSDLSATQAMQKADAALLDVGIDPKRRDEYPHAFSGGMRQRVVIALALSTDPDLIIADEPTTALDVSVQAQVLSVLKDLCAKRGASVILITHDMGVIAQTTDRVAVMYAGRLVELGPTPQVLSAPSHPYTQGLMASTPTIASALSGEPLHQIPGSMPKLDALPNGCTFHPRCPKAIDRCGRENPPQFTNGVACWLYEDASK